jgi:uncharacterized protein
VRAVAVRSVGEFLQRAGALLTADEARHNLILGIAGVVRDRPEVYPEFRLWVVEDGGAPVAAALLTPPYNLILADAATREAVACLAGALRDGGLSLPGVIGNRPTVDWFNEAWLPQARVRPCLQMAQGVFSLEQVRPVLPVPGQARPARPGEEPMLLDWLEAFSREALPQEPFVRERTARGVARAVDPEVREAGIWLWEDQGAAVALAAFGSPTPGGARVGPVYTPPERRRRGYGTGVVAALSAWLLAQGRHRCFLYTDLANPTSNAIYRRIGYEQVAESAQYGYEPAG